MSTSQENAQRKAQSYLAWPPFDGKASSRLEFEGFSNTDATFGVDR
jgi:phage terminase large subunit-like protein